MGGVGPISLMTTRSHSTFHSLQAALSKTSPRAGLGFQANYTWSKSLDDSSTPLPGLFGSGTNTILQTPPQGPRNPGAEKGPSIFDITHTEFAHRSRGEPIALQFRAEFFNVFNLVNFGLPSNVVVGSGFGIISQTAGPSRQIQVSLKLFY